MQTWTDNSWLRYGVFNWTNAIFHEVAKMSLGLFQKLAAIPPSAFYNIEHKHLGENFIRFCFIKVIN